MNAAHPTLTAAWLFVSWGLLVLLLAAGAVGYIQARVAARRDGSRRNLVLLTVWFGTVVNGCFFAAAGAADANVRYAVSNVVAAMCALLVWVLVAHCTRAVGGVRHGQDIPRG
jgi:hypothetical protein